MFSSTISSTPSNCTIQFLHPANDNHRASRRNLDSGYLERMAQRSCVTREYIRRTERDLLEIKMLLLGTSERAPHHHT